MQVHAALSLDLTLLTQALDQPGSDVARTLHQLTTDARLAVGSYLGLSLSTGGDPPFTVTALEDDVRPGDVRSSLLVPLPHGGAGAVAPGAAPGAALVLYAARAGAFVDLAADLSWFTGVPLPACVLDQHLTVDAPAPGARSVHAASVVDQAIGVLIGRGHQPDRAHEELTAQAAHRGTDRYAEASRILTALATGGET